jgi:hypothetical protein
MRRFVILFIALLAGTTTVRAQSPAIRPGIYDLTITFGGGELQGVLTITAPQRDSIAATLMVMGHQSPVAATSHTGSKLVLDSTSPGQTIHYDLEFRGENVTGPFTYGDGNGTVAGHRRTGS